MSTPFDLDNGATIQTFTPGTRVFGRYTLQRLLGNGKKGDVWLAKDENLSLDVAIKILRNYPHFRALEMQSGKLMDLAHHAVVRFHDTAGDEQLGGFVMEYFESRPLAAMLAEREFRPYEVTEIKRWVRDLFSALAYAHDKLGVIHQDIRLANLLVSPEGVMKVSEFGLAPAPVPGGADTATETAFNHLPAVSPQVLAGEAPTQQDDLYAAAAAVYELLTGRPVFPGGNIPLQIQKKVPASITACRAELQIKGEAIPRAWEEWIGRCLEKDPANRPASAQEVLSLIESGSTTTRGTSSRGAAFSQVGEAMGTAVGNLREKDFSWLGSLIKGAVALGLLGAAVWHFWMKPMEEELADRRCAIAEIETRDTEAKSQIEEYKKSGNKTSTLTAAKETAEKAASRWEQFIEDYESDSLPFSREDDNMLRDARRHQKNWEDDAESLEKRITFVKEQEKELLTEVDSAFAAQREEDAKHEGKSTAEQMRFALERSDAWGKMLKQYGGEDAPQMSSYQTVLNQAKAAQDRWQALVDQQRKEADDWIAGWEKKIEGVKANLVLPEKTKQDKLALIQSGIDELNKDNIPLPAATKVSAFNTELNRLKEETTKIPDPVPVMLEPFPTTLAGLFKHTPLADKPEALQKKALMRLQKQFTEGGVYKDKVDGAPGPALEKSLKDWQTKKSLPVTGLLDAGTWATTEIGMMVLADLEKSLNEEKVAMTEETTTTPKEGASKPPRKSKLSPRGINYSGREPSRGYYESIALGWARLKKDTIGGSMNSPGGKLKPEAAKDPEKVAAWNYHVRTWVDYCQWSERQ